MPPQVEQLRGQRDPPPSVIEEKIIGEPMRRIRATIKGGLHPVDERNAGTTPDFAKPPLFFVCSANEPGKGTGVAEALYRGRKGLEIMAVDGDVTDDSVVNDRLRRKVPKQFEH